MESRPYQVADIEKIRDSIRKGNREVLYVLPTGGGKTHVASEIIKGAIAKNKKVLFLANRRKLVHQCAAKLEREGIHHGVIMAGVRPKPVAPVQVCSIQTLDSRYTKKQTGPEAYRPIFPDADLIIPDEAHVSLSEMYDNVRKEYAKAVILGLTATPCKGNGKGLGKVYRDMVMGPTIADLTAQGFLVPVEYYGPHTPDTSHIRISRITGDFDENDAANAQDRKELVGDIVKNWFRICPERQTVAFAQSVAHSIHIAEAFNEVGVKAAHIDADTPDGERQDIFDALHSGYIRVVSNYGILVEGWDEPQISCAILAQMTRNPGRYIQMAGRVLRPFFGKENAILIDHSGNVARHGWLDEDFGWSLDADETIQERAARKPKPEDPARARTCPACKFVFKRLKICPKCGHKMTVKEGKPVEVIDAELQRLERKKRLQEKKALDNSPETKARWYSELLAYGEEKGHKKGWAKFIYKQKYGGWPDDSRVQKVGVEVSEDVLNYLKYMRIRKVKSRASDEGKARPMAGV